MILTSLTVVGCHSESGRRGASSYDAGDSQPGDASDSGADAGGDASDPLPDGGSDAQLPKPDDGVSVDERMFRGLGYDGVDTDPWVDEHWEEPDLGDEESYAAPLPDVQVRLSTDISGKSFAVASDRALHLVRLSDQDAPSETSELPIPSAHVLYAHESLLIAVAPIVPQRGVIELISIDITDPTAPKILQRKQLTGSWQQSALVTGSDASVLYVLHEAEQNQPSILRLTSFKIPHGKRESDGITQLHELEFEAGARFFSSVPGGFVIRHAANPQSEDSSTLSLVDVSDPGGSAHESAHITTKHSLVNPRSLDLRGGILRVRTGAYAEHLLETFDARALPALPLLDTCTYLDEQADLQALTFLPQGALFAHGSNIHAVSFGADGKCTPNSVPIELPFVARELQPVLNGTRVLIQGTTPDDDSVISLMDASDLAGQAPLLASQTLWPPNHWRPGVPSIRVFPYEDAVQVEAPDGTSETGIVLIRLQGYVKSGTVSDQLALTFSSSTLTRRDHEPDTRLAALRSRIGPALFVGISPDELTVLDASNPDAMEERGRTPLAPLYRQVVDLGDYVARLRDPGDASGALVELVADAGPLNHAPVLSTLEVPWDAQLLGLDNTLILVSTRATDLEHQEYETTLTAYDVSVPSAPTLVSQRISTTMTPVFDTSTRNLCGSYGQGCGLLEDYPRTLGQYDNFTRKLEHSIVFGQVKAHSEEVKVEECRYRVFHDQPAGSCPTCLTAPSGGVDCLRALPGGEQQCVGKYWSCDAKANCERVTPQQIGAKESCSTKTIERAWPALSLTAFGLEQPASPSLVDLTFAPEDEITGLIGHGDSLLVAFQRRAKASKPGFYVQHFVRELDLSEPKHPVEVRTLALPGRLVAANGARWYALDAEDGEQGIDFVLQELDISATGASIRTQRSYAGQEVVSVRSDADGRLFLLERSDHPAFSDKSFRLHVLAADGLVEERVVELDGKLGVTPILTHRARALYEGDQTYSIDATTSEPFSTLPTRPLHLTTDGDEVIGAFGRQGLERL